VAAEAGVAPVLSGLPSSVEAVRRGDLLFLFNHGATAATVPLPGPGVDAVTGRDLDGAATVKGGGTVVARLR
jgi:beta-galactosidase